MDGEEVRRLAERILPELPELLDTATAARVAEEVRAALAAGDTFAVSTALSRYDATRAWMRERLDVDGAPRGYTPLAGLDPHRWAERYACPECGYEWFRPTGDDEVPLCDQGHEPVRLRAAGA
jgi:rubrerythrin